MKLYKKLERNYIKVKHLLGFVERPWTVATYMLEGKGTTNKEIAKKFAYENPGGHQKTF